MASLVNVVAAILHFQFPNRYSKTCNLHLEWPETAMHYGGELTRTTPVDKQFTTRQKEIYDIVLNAHESAMHRYIPAYFLKMLICLLVKNWQKD